MSDDDEYYEWEEEYLLEDLVPDLVVSTSFAEGLSSDLAEITVI